VFLYKYLLHIVEVTKLKINHALNRIGEHQNGGGL